MVEDCIIGYNKINDLTPNNKLETWYLRNDSKNISASLNTEDYQLKFITDNNCYCNQNVIKPKLFQRSKTCVNPIQEIKLKPKIRFDFCTSNKRHYCENDNNKSHNNSDNYGCSCRKLASNYKNNDLTYTKLRKNYEDIIRSSNDYNTRLDLDQINKRRTNRSSYFESNNNIKQIQNEEIESKQTSEKTEKGNEELLKRLSDFRNDHYFETHSCDISSTKIPSHICKYQFQLNNRNLAKGLNTDCYGINRCVICNKPMLNKNNNNNLKEGRNLPNYYKYNLIPNEINLGNGSNIEIEMEINKSQDNSCLNYLKGGNNGKFDYVDTYALRYQKGVY